jgi:hypothetical protein
MRKGFPIEDPRYPYFFALFIRSLQDFFACKKRKIYQNFKNQFYVGFCVPLDSVRVQERDEGALHHPLDRGRDWPEGFHYFTFFLLEKYFVAYRKETINASYKSDRF